MPDGSEWRIRRDGLVVPARTRRLAPGKHVDRTVGRRWRSGSSTSWPSTSRRTAPPARTGGYALARTTIHRTRTPSATGGARRCATPALPASSSTSCGTSTPLPHCRRVRRRDRPALARPGEGDHNPQHPRHLWPTAKDRTRKAAESIMSASLGQATPPHSPS